MISFVLPAHPFKVSHAKHTKAGDQVPVANDLTSLWGEPTGKTDSRSWPGPVCKNTGAPSLLPSSSAIF